MEKFSKIVKRACSAIGQVRVTSYLSLTLQWKSINYYDRLSEVKESYNEQFNSRFMEKLGVW